MDSKLDTEALMAMPTFIELNVSICFLFLPFPSEGFIFSFFGLSYFVFQAYSVILSLFRLLIFFPLVYSK